MINYIHVLHVRTMYKIDRRGGSKNGSLGITKIILFWLKKVFMYKINRRGEGPPKVVL